MVINMTKKLSLACMVIYCWRDETVELHGDQPLPCRPICQSKETSGKTRSPIGGLVFPRFPCFGQLEIEMLYNVSSIVTKIDGRS